MRRKLTQKMSRPGIRLKRLGAMKFGSKLSLAVLILMALTAVFAPLLAPYDPQKIFLARQPPSAEFWFGTDEKGRDILSRLLYGARYSLTIGLSATGFALVCGAIIGSIAAITRKAISEVIMRIMDIVMSFPGIALAAVVVIVFGQELPVIIIAIGVLYVPQLTRVVRANVLSAYNEDYVNAVLVSGARAPWVLIKHVMRNTLAPVLVFATVLVADAIIFEASLSFINAGISEPTATWGNILADARGGVLVGRWWQALYPGLAIMITVLCLNIVSEGITDTMVAAPKSAPRAQNSEQQTSESEEVTAEAEREADQLILDPSEATRQQEQTLQTRIDQLRTVEAQRTDRLVFHDTEQEPLLEVNDLCIGFARHGDVDVVDRVSFSVRPGETMGLVGESGCGKSITALAIMGLLDPSAKISGAVKYQGKDLLKMSTRERNSLRGTELAMIYQDALASLNPSMLIKTQMRQLTKRGGTRTAEELLEMVGLDPKRTLRSYPHELSGGQRQRVVIAMALTRDPKLIIADEPTTALDVTVQKQVIEVLNELREKLGFAMVFVSHDLALVAEVAHRVTVMYAGQVVEQGNVADVLVDPRHEYTRGLLGSVLSIESGSGRLHQVPGTVPSPADFPAGNRFAPRSSRPGFGLNVKPVMQEIPGKDHRYAVQPEELRPIATASSQGGNR